MVSHTSLLLARSSPCNEQLQHSGAMLCISSRPVPGCHQGNYLFKLLAVDVPTASSAEQRLYVEGDAKLYHRGGVINELRDPFIQARPTCRDGARLHSSAPACEPHILEVRSATAYSIDTLP